MAKIFGVLLIVLGVWVGMEIYTKGMDEAFGGALARLSAPLETDETTDYDASDSTSSDGPTERDTRPSTAHGSLAQRVGVKVQSDIDAGAHRDGVEDDPADDD